MNSPRSFRSSLTIQAMFSLTKQPNRASRRQSRRQAVGVAPAGFLQSGRGALNVGFEMRDLQQARILF
jgi:hypothetical protein